MKKIAIFLEGQSELIFIRHFLPQVIGWEKISFKCFKLYSDDMQPERYDYTNEKANVHFLIVNVRNDEKVLTAVKDREKWLIQKGYEKIIALRDMYSQEYYRRSNGVIDKNVTKKFIDQANTTIKNMSDPSKIKMHFAIMELEAWFLGMYGVFERVKPELNIAYIEGKLGFNLSVIDPQTSFFKPADDMDRIFRLVGLRYQKTECDVESLCSKMGTSDFSNALENGRCVSFKKFYDEILN
jgi:hypothetical protein